MVQQNIPQGEYKSVPQSQDASDIVLAAPAGSLSMPGAGQNQKCGGTVSAPEVFVSGQKGVVLWDLPTLTLPELTNMQMLGIAAVIAVVVYMLYAPSKMSGSATMPVTSAVPRTSAVPAASSGAAAALSNMISTVNAGGAQSATVSAMFA